MADRESGRPRTPIRRRAATTAFLMPTDFAGEILWDCLPSGRHAGGAPFNVTAHLAQIGVSASLISCIGRDALGDEILKVAQDKGVNTEFVTRARIGLGTGTVLVTVDENGNATYELVQPAAWDEIKVSAEALEAVSKGARVDLRLARRPFALQSRSIGSPSGRERAVEILRRQSAPALRRSAARHATGAARRCSQAERWRSRPARVLAADR